MVSVRDALTGSALLSSLSRPSGSVQVGLRLSDGMGVVALARRGRFRAAESEADGLRSWGEVARPPRTRDAFPDPRAPVTLRDVLAEDAAKDRREEHPRQQPQHDKRKRHSLR